MSIGEKKYSPIDTEYVVGPSVVVVVGLRVVVVLPGNVVVEATTVVVVGEVVGVVGVGLVELVVLETVGLVDRGVGAEVVALGMVVVNVALVDVLAWIVLVMNPAVVEVEAESLAAEPEVSASSLSVVAVVESVVCGAPPHTDIRTEMAITARAANQLDLWESFRG